MKELMKETIEELKLDVENLITEMKIEDEDAQAIIDKIDDLDCELESLYSCAGWSFDVDVLKDEVVQSILDNNDSLESFRDKVNDIQEDYDYVAIHGYLCRIESLLEYEDRTFECIYDFIDMLEEIEDILSGIEI